MADVHCPCGSGAFALLFPGQTHEYQGARIPAAAEIDDRFFFLIKVRCVDCGQEHLLLDKDHHGWDGFVCHDEEQAALPRPALVPWQCSDCGGIEHQASVTIRTQGKRDFLEETGGELSEDRWPDAFDWFTMSIKYTGCNRKTPEWVSYETA